MSLSAQEKSEIIGKYQRESNDVGSPEVQVALLTSRINQVMKHFETHPKDRHSRYGLMKMVHARRGLLKHLRGQSHERYAELIQSLGLRR
ncbi:MAG: 30S ribosomal protein S15 [Gammaproteobacteria bacterium]|nr:30S ribosomal protein S15 [Gammaproteobacteria bacterium]